MRGLTRQTLLNGEYTKSARLLSLEFFHLAEGARDQSSLRAGVCRPREKLARSITSLAPALTLTTPCLCSSAFTLASPDRWQTLIPMLCGQEMAPPPPQQRGEEGRSLRVLNNTIEGRSLRVILSLSLPASSLLR